MKFTNMIADLILVCFLTDFADDTDIGCGE